MVDLSPGSLSPGTCDDGGMLLDELLGGFPRTAFMQEHYLKQPFARRSAAHPLQHLATWSLIDWLVEQTPCDLMLVRDGSLWPGERPATAR